MEGTGRIRGRRPPGSVQSYGRPVRDAQQILAEAKVIAVVAGIDYVEDRCLVIERANGNLSQLS